MSLAYTAPTWEDGSGTGISASQLQAMCNCIEGLVQGVDKAVHAVQLNGSIITLTYADGTSESFSTVDAKYIAQIDKTSTTGLVDTYTITFTDGTTSTFEVTNGYNGRDGAIQYSEGDGIHISESNEISADVTKDDLDEYIATANVSSGVITFSGIDDTGSNGYDVYFDVTANSTNMSPYAKLTGISGEGTSSMVLTYETDADNGTNTAYLRVVK